MSTSATGVLIDYIRRLEGRDSHARGDEVLSSLDALGLKPVIQKRHQPHIRNIIVDLAPNTEAKRLVFSAHYDAVAGTPGANDDASGVAVLLGLCRELRGTSLPVRAIFFDREEAWVRVTPFRLGLLGSLYYVWKYGIHDIYCVYNLEFVGKGDCVCIWPVAPGVESPTARSVEETAARLSLPARRANIPALLFSSDHLSFRLRGCGAVTLSLLPSEQLPDLERAMYPSKMPRLLLRGRQALPEPLGRVHTRRDSSAYLDEESLQRMLSLLLLLAREPQYVEKQQA